MFYLRFMIVHQWSQYLRCDGLPDPRVVPQIQTYLHLWEHLKVVDAEELEKRCIEVLPVRTLKNLSNMLVHVFSLMFFFGHRLKNPFGYLTAKVTRNQVYLVLLKKGANRLFKAYRIFMSKCRVLY